MVITTSDFQKDALREADAPNKMPVSLIAGSKLVDLLVKHEVGIKRTPAIILEIDQEYFENESDTGVSVITSSGKSRSIWPLPGGTTRYIQTLNEILEAIEQGISTREELIKWLIDHYENVTSSNTAYGYTNVPKNMGLLNMVNGKLLLSEKGREYYNTKDVELLYSIIADNILAFGEVVEYLVTSVSPQSEQSVLEYVNDILMLTGRLMHK